MSEDLETTFLTNYLQSLGERTRVENKGTNWGFDWVIYNLGLAAGGKPVRLPFLRAGKAGYAKTKTEPEFGVDLSFLSRDGKQLDIFVLKDEPLTKAKWLGEGFDDDLRMAAYPDLKAPGLGKVRRVVITLAYNKDDHATGIKLFDQLAGALGGRQRNGVTVKFERWNLSELVARTKGQLLSASLLPQRFFGQFSYLSAQVADFRHGSDGWEQQVIPNWRRLLADILGNGKPERAIRLISMALVILRGSAAANASVTTGWIALVEEAVLATWAKYATHKGPKVRRSLHEMWLELYLASLDRFYQGHIDDLATTHAIDSNYGGTFVDAVAASMLAYWHLGRIGVLALSYAEYLDANPKLRTERRDAAQLFANWAARLIAANVSTFRPILDLHHIEIFLIWRIFRDTGRQPEEMRWITELFRRLWLRRFGHVAVPFPEAHNDVDLVFETVATSKKPPEYCDQTSCLLQVLFELACALPEGDRDAVVAAMYRKLAMGFDASDSETAEKTLDLTSWAPFPDWEKKILTPDTPEGECYILMPIEDGTKLSSAQLAEKLRTVVAGIRERHPFEFSKVLPNGLVALACIVYGHPLPPEFWRTSVFPPAAVPAGA